MQESKFQVTHWKEWKITRKLLIETKRDVANDKKAISYSLEMPGGSHQDVIKRYNKLIEYIDVYDQYIHAYAILIKRLEESITSLLNKEERNVIIIYATYPKSGDSNKREEEALKAGYSRSYFYKVADQAFNKLDNVLNIENRIEKYFKIKEDGSLIIKSVD